MTRTVAFLHGLTGSPEAWDEVARHLPSDVRVIRPALVGHDRGSIDEDVRSFDQEVARIASLLEGEVVAAAHLCGYSMGARVGLALLCTHPELFASATLVGLSPGLADEAERRARIESDERWARMLETDGLRAFVDAWEAQALFATQSALPESVRAARRRLRLAHDPRGLAHALRTLGLGRMADHRPALGRIRARVDLVAGSLDAKFRALADETATLLLRAGRDATVRIVPGAGHDVPLEQPRALAHSIIRRITT